VLEISGVEEDESVCAREVAGRHTNAKSTARGIALGLACFDILSP
jgi:hypothetical protein